MEGEREKVNDKQTPPMWKAREQHHWQSATTHTVSHSPTLPRLPFSKRRPWPGDQEDGGTLSTLCKAIFARTTQMSANVCPRFCQVIDTYSDDTDKEGEKHQEQQELTVVQFSFAWQQLAKLKVKSAAKKDSLLMWKVKVCKWYTVNLPRSSEKEDWHRRFCLSNYLLAVNCGYRALHLDITNHTVRRWSTGTNFTEQYHP